MPSEISKKSGQTQAINNMKPIRKNAGSVQ